MVKEITATARFIKHNDWATIRHAFLKKDAHPYLQFIKYVICGLAAFTTHQVVWLGVSMVFFPSIDSSIPQETRALNSGISNCIALIFSTVVAYLTNIRWVFTPGRHSRSLEIFYFFAVGAFSFAGGLAAGPWMIKIFGLNTLVAQLFMAVTSVLINFVCRKFFIFKS